LKHEPAHVNFAVKSPRAEVVEILTNFPLPRQILFLQAYRRVKLRTTIQMKVYAPIRTRGAFEMNAVAKKKPVKGKKLAKKKATKPFVPRPITKSDHPTTLAVDIGGTGLKVMLLNREGKQLSERLRTETPELSTPSRILAALDALVAQIPEFDRVSVGFPGVIQNGVTLTTANIHKLWRNFPLQKTLAKRWKKPVKVANDADVQGYGAIQGHGSELVITLGTGMGAALFTNGHLYPGLELGHHPWRGKLSYEDCLGKRGFKKYGRARWNELLKLAIAQTLHTFNWDHLYIGGGNAKKIDFKLPPNVTIVPNTEGLFGGVALWEE
jgi:polyphosphate glucokinase